MIYFSNSTIFSPQVLSIIGLSAKDSDNAIGRFGTGLKYAISIILRNDCEITINSKTHGELTFSKQTEEFRGKQYQSILMQIDGGDPLKLPFTLDYGRDWKPWQALRELLANCLDEHGFYGIKDTSAETLITVRGAAMEAAWSTREGWYVGDAPERPSVSGVKVYPEHPGGIFYRGFLIGVIEEAKNGYAVPDDQHMPLTEDRTLEAYGRAKRAIGTALYGPPATKEFLNYAFDENEEFLRTLCFWTKDIGQVLKDHADHPNLPPILAALLSEDLEARGLFKKASISPHQQAMIDSALALAQEIEPNMTLDDFNFTPNIRGCYGLYHVPTDEIWIGLSGIQSIGHLAGTLLEEYVHKTYSKADGREFQDYLLAQLFQRAELAQTQRGAK